MLGVSLLFEAGSWIVALKAFRAMKGDASYVEAFRRSKNPTAFTVLFEDRRRSWACCVLTVQMGPDQVVLP